MKNSVYLLRMIAAFAALLSVSAMNAEAGTRDQLRHLVNRSGATRGGSHGQPTVEFDVVPRRFDADFIYAWPAQLSVPGYDFIDLELRISFDKHQFRSGGGVVDSSGKGFTVNVYGVLRDGSRVSLPQFDLSNLPLNDFNMLEPGSSTRGVEPLRASIIWEGSHLLVSDFARRFSNLDRALRDPNFIGLQGRGE